MKEKYKTGEAAPESGKYKVEQLANGNLSSVDNTTIDLKTGETFPPSPITNEAAYWIKASRNV